MTIPFRLLTAHYCRTDALLVGDDVSAYRDSLPDDETRARYDAATQAAGRILAQARYERDLLAATHGTRAVAEAAWYPGHPLGTVEAIQGRYEQLQEEARQERDREKAATARGEPDKAPTGDRADRVGSTARAEAGVQRPGRGGKSSTSCRSREGSTRSGT